MNFLFKYKDNVLNFEVFIVKKLVKQKNVNVNVNKIKFKVKKIVLFIMINHFT